MVRESTPEVWKRELANAFEALMGKPFEESPTDAEYAVYHWNDVTSSECSTSSSAARWT